MSGFSPESIAKSQATKKANKEARLAQELLVKSQQTSRTFNNITHDVLNLSNGSNTGHHSTTKPITVSGGYSLHRSDNDEMVWFHGFLAAMTNLEVRAKNGLAPCTVIADAVLDARQRAQRMAGE